VGPQDLLRRALEDLFANEDAVENAPERVDVRRRPDVRGRLADLLGRDPPDGSRAGVCCKLGLRRAVEARIVALLAQPRETEIENVRTRTSARRREIEHHVRRLEIAMNHAARVRVREARENLVDQCPNDRPRQRRRVHPFVHAAARERLHHQVRRAVRQRAEIARAHERRVLERGDGARLLMKPPRLLRARLPFGFVGRAKALERDTFAAHEIATEIDDPHTAATEFANHLVTLREQRSGLRRNRCGFVALRHGGSLA